MLPISIRSKCTFTAVLCLAAAQLSAQSTFNSQKAQDEAVKFLSELVKIDNSNPPGNETRAAEYIKGVLAAEGIHAEIFESARGRGNLVARLKGNAKSGHCCSWDIWTWLELSETNGRWIPLERQSKAAIFTGAGPLTIRAWTPLIWKCSCCCTASRCHSTGT